MTCSDMQEADQVSRCLSELNTGCLVTYLQAEDLMLNAPGGKVALLILATNDSPAMLRQTLRWLRNRWSGCPITVVSDVGSGEHEMAAREGGALFLVRPVADRQWSAILARALEVAQQSPSEPAASSDPTRQGNRLTTW